jgi:hypothetical protein
VSEQKDDLSSAPVALIMFNRPDLTIRVAKEILDAAPSELYLIADGPRPDHADDVALCAETRDLVLSLPWECPVHTLFAEENMGLRARVSSGLDWVFSHVDEAIILEDDCLADQSFFPYASELLHRYAADSRVGAISGNNFLRGKRVSEDSYFFSSDVRIWGWATWARVWNDFSKEGLDYPWTIDEATSVVSAIPSPGRRKALLRDAERAHRINSWALPFVLHSAKRGYLSVVPAVNLVTNVGFGARSTHTKFESFTAEVGLENMPFPLSHPSQVEPKEKAGAIEVARARRQWVSYPLSHPIEFTRRVLRYLRVILGR